MIGIHTAYNHSEATAMAVNLAELSWELGCEPGLLSHGRREAAVYPDWDGRVQSEAKVDIQEWLGRCSHVVWTSLQPQRMARARRLRRKNILLALWHQLRPEDSEQLAEVDVIVCPSLACQRLLREHWGLRNTTYVEWALAQPIHHGALSTAPPTCRVLLPIDGRLKQQLPKWIYAAEVLLDRVPHLELTILQQTPGTRLEAELLRGLLRKHAPRVQVRRGHAPAERLALYRQYDWLLWPAACDNSSHFPLEAVYHNLPVLSLGVPPLHHGLLPGLCSHLIATDVAQPPDGPARPDPKLTQLIDGLQPILADAQARLYLLTADWHELVQRQQHFRTFWRRQWDLGPA